MGQWKGRQKEYRRKYTPRPNSKMSYAYGQLGHFGLPASEAATIAEKQVAFAGALLRMSKESEERRLSLEKGTISNTVVDWARVDKILRASPRLHLKQAIEMAQTIQEDRNYE